MNVKKRFFQLLGPCVFLLIKWIELDGLSLEGQAVLACAAWIAIWWISEAVELEVTSLLPILILPLSGGLNIKDTTASYGHPFIFLFMGGFIIGLAIEKWNLHKRIAFGIIQAVGTSEKKIILGFMLATAFLSMWISNTATAIMMLPIGLSVIHQFDSNKKFGLNLMLGIGYSASIGGMVTLIGTPPNIIFAGIVKDSLGQEISFSQWMVFALPFSVILLFLTWIYLTRSFKANSNKNDQPTFEKLGKISNPEKRVLIIFIFVALLWITRSFLLNKIVPEIDDTIIALFGGLILFIIPSGNGDSNLMNWKTAQKLPWGILLIFGAGLAIAKGFSDTDLATWLGGHFLTLQGVPIWIILLLVIASINFLTEITSNTATASMVLPILIALAASLSLSPYPLMAGAVLASSCAFMLPVATPPNAIIFSSGKVSIGQMVRTGFFLNLTSVLLIFIAVKYWMSF